MIVGTYISCGQRKFKVQSFLTQPIDAYQAVKRRFSGNMVANLNRHASIVSQVAYDLYPNYWWMSSMLAECVADNNQQKNNKDSMRNQPSIT